ILNHPINYDASGRVSSLVDARGNQRLYTYNPANTRVVVLDSAGNVSDSWTQNINALNADAGTLGANHFSSTIAYEDPHNPYRPTTVVNRNNQAVTLTYDQFGNVLTETNSRGIITAYQYDYNAFALGRLTQVQVGSKTPTTFAYFANGLLQTVY